MRCSDFLERYSEFRDGQIEDEGLRQALTDHLLRCPRCTQYHARIARGTLVLRSASDLEPSPRLRRALKRRPTGRPVSQPALPAPAGALTWLLLITAVAFLLWEVSARPAQPALRAQAGATRGEPAHAVLNLSAFAVPAFLTRREPAVRPESAFVTQTASAR